MRKPGAEIYDRFTKLFKELDKKRCGENPKAKPQYILPYFISAHPGSSEEDARALTAYIKSHGAFFPDQTQDFYPTPGTLATCMYYTGKDPETGEEVHIPKEKERKTQREILHPTQNRRPSPSLRAKRSNPDDKRNNKRR
jgi:radical SAM superfamily enzyme YgiQ (UPF0313 family)